MDDCLKTIIMAGGKGTRISQMFPDIPKPLIPMTDTAGISKPVLQWEIESLVSQGFTDIILTVSYLYEQIEDFFGDGSKLGARISYFVEKTPLGNAGALFKLRPDLGDESFLLLNADSIFEIDFNRMIRFHKEHGGKVTLFTHPNSHPYDSGLLITDTDGSVSEWLAKEDPRPKWYNNLVNAGLHVISPSVLDEAIHNGQVVPDKIGHEIDGKIYKVDLDRMILKPLCGQHVMFSYTSPEYVKDMGTPERYEQVSRDYRCGIVSAKNLSNPQKAIFLDRDGTINRFVGFLTDIEKFELLPDAAEAIRRINESGYLAVIVTNQPVIARGEVSVEELDRIHAKMETLLGASGAYIDALYYCPHHPDKGFEGELPELKFECDCRKPKPGLLLRAASDLNIDLGRSWMVGDGERDILAGRNAGCHTALIESSDYKTVKCEDFGQEVTGGSLAEVIDRILG